MVLKRTVEEQKHKELLDKLDEINENVNWVYSFHNMLVEIIDRVKGLEERIIEYNALANGENPHVAVLKHVYGETQEVVRAGDLDDED